MIPETWTHGADGYRVTGEDLPLDVPEEDLDELPKAKRGRKKKDKEEAE